MGHKNIYMYFYIYIIFIYNIYIYIIYQHKFHHKSYIRSWFVVSLLSQYSLATFCTSCDNCLVLFSQLYQYWQYWHYELFMEMILHLILIVYFVSGDCGIFSTPAARLGDRLTFFISSINSWPPIPPDFETMNHLL